ncbi:MAG: hypothetical protein DRQ88_00735 [Epsilonproteobacteria bacterium]|nr:MAG: hypothetical protein DRQ89_10270 [Campylobacterota bacterium]RLA68160.1 MAG: hypothetical protein DRQ88_00735 [Campylobacterota bacterium]
MSKLLIFLLSFSILSHADENCGDGFKEVPNEITIPSLKYGGYIKFNRDILFPRFSPQYQINNSLILFRNSNIDFDKFKRGQKIQIIDSNSKLRENSTAVGMNLLVSNKILINFEDHDEEDFYYVSDINRRLQDYFQICQKI